MRPEQREAILALTRRADGRRRLEPEDFVGDTGIDDPRSWALSQLQGAIEHRDPDDVELAMLVGAVFGVDERWVVPLTAVLDAEWTVSHEEAAFALGGLKDPRAVPALVRAAHRVPQYLDYDESRGLAVKAVHALGLIPGPEAESALQGLLEHEDHTLRRRVERQLVQRQAPPP